MAVKATVIIPTYKDWDSISRCLHALSKQTIKESEFEIIIADNNETPDVPKTLKVPKNCRIIWQPKAGSYAARNAALRETNGKLIFFTDSDCMPTQDWLSRGIGIFKTRPNVQRIAGKVLTFPTNGKWNSWSIFDSVFNLRQDNYALRGFAVTANLAVRKEVFELVGPFSEERFSGGDMAWNRHATKLGISIIYDEAMVVEHPARETFLDCALKTRRIAGARYTAKSGRPIARRIPRLKYLLPSFAAASELWQKRSDHSAPNLFRAYLCHYILGWVYNCEILRLGLLGGKASRS